VKKESLRIFLMFGFLAILAVSSAHAQSRDEQTASIPFAFTVGDRTFSAGQYSVTRLNPQSSIPVLAIKSADKRLSKITLAAPVRADKERERAVLVFNKYGDQYFLAQVWMPAEDTGLELPKSRSERTLARKVGEPAPERKAIALDARRR
jgi:hypothetical protein